jgi:hypothetical protein
MGAETNKGDTTMGTSDNAKERTDDFQMKFAEEGATTAFQLAWMTVQNVAKYATLKIKVQLAMSRYAKTYAERYGDVKVLGMSQPVPLYKVYTAVRVIPPDYLSAFTRLDEMEQHFRSGGRNEPLHHKAAIVSDGIQTANEVRFLSVLGAPGSGKSTFLRRLGQESLLAREDSPFTGYQHAKLPVLIELRRFKDEAPNLFDCINHEFANCGFPESQDFVQTALDQGRLLVLLDGLDEVPDAQLDSVITTVRDFVDRYGTMDEGNRFITSCRTAHYKNYFPRFTDVVLADFSDDQIGEFAKNWFYTPRALNADTHERFLSRLHEPTNAGALELARTPLLLTFLCLTFQYGQDLPPTRATLYRRALEILLREWAAERRVHNEPVYAELHAELECDMLAEMAVALFREDRFFFTRQEALDQIRRFMEQELTAPRSLNADQILTAIEVQQGLIVRRAQDAYSFSHLTIQEYLTAKKLWEGEGWREAVQEHLFDERWGVVFELMAGMGKADSLLLAMAQRNQADAAQNTQSDAEIRWINEHTVFDSLSSTRSAAARFVMLSLVRSLARARDRELTHALVDILARDVARELALVDVIQGELHVTLFLHRVGARDPARDFDRACRRLSVIIARRLISPGKMSVMAEMCQALASTQTDLESTVGRLNLPALHDSSNLSRYLRACHLIFGCRQAAYSVTTAAWDRVCDMFLRLPAQHDAQAK